jgi:hypothetical protein
MMKDGTWIPEGHESDVLHGQGLPFPAPSTKSVFQRSTPGILVYSRRGQLLHMNRRALELAGHFDRETGPATMTLSRLVSEFHVQVQDSLDNRTEANVWELFELKRFLIESGRKFMLRGFGLPNRNSSDHSRVIIILDMVELQQACGASHARAMVHSPDRESAA